MTESMAIGLADGIFGQNGDTSAVFQVAKGQFENVNIGDFTYTVKPEGPGAFMSEDFLGRPCRLLYNQNTENYD